MGTYELICKDDFDLILQRQGWHNYSYISPYDDPNVIILRWLTSSNADKRYTYETFYNRFGTNTFRKLLRAIFTHPRTYEELERSCSKRKLDEHLTFMKEQEIAMEAQGIWRPGFQYKDVEGIGKTLEWYIAEWFRLMLKAPARHSVTVEDIADGGDLDVVAFLDGKPIMIECKSGNPANISEAQLELFLRRAADFNPEIALLLIDTESEVNNQLEMIKKVYFESSLVDSRTEWSRRLNVKSVHVTNVNKSIERTLRSVLRSHFSNDYADRPLINLPVFDYERVRSVFNSVIGLVKLAEVPAATDEEVKQYYNGAPLTWNIIAAKGDVARDLGDKLLSNFSTSIQRTSMLCLSGEPGSGKSTLAWRVAATIAKSLNRPLLHILKNDVDMSWYKLQEVVQRYRVPVVILVDDVFRDYNVRQALASLGPDLNMVIIATSRSNEIPDDLRLPFSLHIEELSAPTPNEKTNMLHQLGLNDRILGAAQSKRLQKANSWLVMMMEMTAGEELPKIVRDSVKRLMHDEVMYRAYEYLCYAGQYDLAVPETLIAALDDHGRFYNLLENPAGKGLIFGDDGGNGTLRTQHSVIAREALKSYRRDPRIIAREFVRAVHITESDHRIFLSQLLFYTLMLDRRELLVRNLLIQETGKIDSILAASNCSELLFYWYGLYRKLREQKKVKEIDIIVLNHKPETYIEWHAHFRLVERRGDPVQIAALIDAAATWLDNNPQDFYVRPAYLGLVERRGGPAQIAALIDAAATWLDNNPQDSEVRKFYLGLVERRGASEQLELAFVLANAWLDHNSTTRDLFMLEGYGRILFKLGRFKESEAQFRRILALKKSYVPSRFDLAWSLYYQGRNEEAYNELQHAKWWTERGNIYPIGGAFNHLGRYYFQEGDLDRAIQCFRDAIHANPDHYGNYRELGRALIEQKDYDSALIAFKDSQKHLPPNISEELRVQLEELIELCQSKMQEKETDTF